MAVVKKEELLAFVRKVIGDRSDEDSLKLLEDVSDTVSSLEQGKGTAYEEMKSDYERQLSELEEKWSKRYRDRFFDGNDGNAGGNTNIDRTPEGGLASAPENESNTSEFTGEDDITIDDIFVDADK